MGSEDDPRQRREKCAAGNKRSAAGKGGDSKKNDIRSQAWWNGGYPFSD